MNPDDKIDVSLRIRAKDAEAAQFVEHKYGLANKAEAVVFSLQLARLITIKLGPELVNKLREKHGF